MLMRGDSATREQDPERASRRLMCGPACAGGRACGRAGRWAQGHADGKRADEAECA